MFEALITFANGETLRLKDGQLIIPISKFANGDNVVVSQEQPQELWHHYNNGLIPSIAELLCKCDFFQLMDYENKIYKSSSVVTVENL